MTRESSVELLALHAVRILGLASSAEAAFRFGLGVPETAAALLDGEASGWVTHTEFGDLEGWSLTESGRAENERRLAAELARVGGAGELCDIHGDFLPLNARLLRACTDWQLRPGAAGRLVANDHTDQVWDAAVIDELIAIDRLLGPLAARLGAVLVRLQGYDTRFSAALTRARSGAGGWIDRTDLDSCHRVWFELHEDLIATLGIDRSVEK